MARLISSTGSRRTRQLSLFLAMVLCLFTSAVRVAAAEDGCVGEDCCSECAPGSGVTRHCNATGEFADTICEPCVAGETFSDAASRLVPCRACTPCPANSRARRACNVTHDAECECDKDHYQELSLLPTASSGDNEVDANGTTSLEERVTVAMTCKACDVCQHGWGAARPCSPMHNTICRKCPAGTFSSVLSATLGCVVCTVCREDQVTLHECTPIQDTVCADKDMGHPSRRVITKPVDSLLHQDEVYDNEGIISVYCAILGAIVLGLLIYVVMKQWKLRSAATKLAGFDPRYGGGSAAVPLTGNSSACGTVKNEYKNVTQAAFECEISPSNSRRMQGSDGSRGSRGSDSAFVAPGSDGYSRDAKSITLDTRLRDICTARRREMEVMLNPRRERADWKALARELGYTSSRIASFDQKAQEKQTGPTRHLFADWAKREDSTVENLLRALCNIGRHDVTLVLLPIQQRTATTLPRTRYKPISVV